MRFSSVQKGKIGEKIAIHYILKYKKEKILEKNFKCIYGEIDIISFTGKNINIYEVKYWENKNFKYGEIAINQTKINKIVKTYDIWISNNNIYSNFDFNIFALIIDANHNINEFIIF